MLQLQLPKPSPGRAEQSLGCQGDSGPQMDLILHLLLASTYRRPHGPAEEPPVWMELPGHGVGKKGDAEAWRGSRKGGRQDPALLGSLC